MKVTAHLQSKTMVSELATLSRDPALTVRPDPAFRAKFRNPDEIIEDDFNGITGKRSVSQAPLQWPCVASWRRSPKD